MVCCGALLCVSLQQSITAASVKDEGYRDPVGYICIFMSSGLRQIYLLQDLRGSPNSVIASVMFYWLLALEKSYSRGFKRSETFQSI